MATCALKQIVCIQEPISSTDICIIDDSGNEMTYQLSYSVDNVTWSDWMSSKDIVQYTSSLSSEFFLRAQVYGIPCNVTLNDSDLTFKVTIAPCFDFNASYSDATYDPYANLDNAIKLNQQLTENVSQIVGIPVYYFKVSPDADSKDVTFKEYMHLNVSSVKYIKMILGADGAMPSSRPMFDEYGLNWETDWETEVSKNVFAMAFGNTAQPQEGDLVYIPMMKRMWQVNAAYEEKKDGFMWIATTFKVFLRKYEVRQDITTGKFEDTIDSIVKNTYEDLFGPTVQGTNEETMTAPVAADGLSDLYQVFERDAYRKSISINNITFVDDKLYHQGMVLADSWYARRNSEDAIVTYQQKYCGSDATFCFYIQNYGASGKILQVGRNSIRKEGNVLYYNTMSIDLDHAGTFLVYVRQSSSMGIVEFGSVEVKIPENIPQRRINSGVFYLDFDNKVTTAQKFTSQFVEECKTDVIFTIPSSDTSECDLITNIKIFTSYQPDEIIFQQYPNNTTLLINDTARKIMAEPGYPVNQNTY